MRYPLLALLPRRCCASSMSSWPMAMANSL
jgi:hypothetical protein